MVNQFGTLKNDSPVNLQSHIYIYKLSVLKIGWCDIPLTNMGEADAKDAGILMVYISFIGFRLLHLCIIFRENAE